MHLKIKHWKLHVLLVGLLIAATWGCGKKESKEPSVENQTVEQVQSTEPFFKLSLAQWSLHKMILDGKLSPLDFAQKANEMGFEGIEYVSALYEEELKKYDNESEAMSALLDTLKSRSQRYGVENLLIMVDGEGHLAATNQKERLQTVENHKKWVDAAAYLGCHSIRVNAHGEGTPEEVAAAAVDGLTRLADYASSKGINVLVENHGGYTSDGQWLAGVMADVNLSNCGTLPDFGNFCMTVGYGSINSEECQDPYDIYKGVEELMPYAKAVSAKSYDFDEEGNQPKIDYTRMMQIVKDAGYKGYVGVEYEGSNLEEIEGIKATKALLLKAAEEVR